MATMITTTSKTALYFKPGGKGRWQLFGVYETREAAFRAVDLLPGRRQVFRLEEVPTPLPETDPTKNELEALTRG